MLEDLSEELQLTLVVLGTLVTLAGLFRCVGKSECVATREEDDNT